MRGLRLIFLLLAALAARADDQISCTANGCGCDYKVNNKSMGYFDLSMLSSKDPEHPKFNASASASGYYYLVNFCDPISVGGGVCSVQDKTAVCQHGGGDQGATYACGRLDRRSFFINGSVVQVVYRNNPGDPNTRETHITLKCNQQQTQPQMTFQTEGPGGFYWLDLEWVHFCPGHLEPDPKSGGGGGGLSPGSLILICAAILLVVYFVAGIICMRYRKGVSGVEMIPNRDFWMELPGYIKDGACFCCKRGATGYEKF